MNFDCHVQFVFEMDDQQYRCLLICMQTLIICGFVVYVSYDFDVNLIIGLTSSWLLRMNLNNII